MSHTLPFRATASGEDGEAPLTPEELSGLARAASDKAEASGTRANHAAAATAHFAAMNSHKIASEAADDAAAAAQCRGHFAEHSAAYQRHLHAAEALSESAADNLENLSSKSPNTHSSSPHNMSHTALLSTERPGNCREGAKRTLQAYGALAAKNAAIRPNSATAFEAKGRLAKEMGAIYSEEISGRRECLNMPLEAADFTDSAGNLGTLTGTLVGQRALENFKLEFPIITRLYTDFSDSPAQYKQTEMTRIVVTPSIVSYDATLDASGRPKGWTQTVPAQTTDVPITLDEHIGVPVIFDSNMLGSTVRRLFDEMAPMASYALAKYFVEKIYKLFTPTNYNGYAAVNGQKVPTAYVTFPVALGAIARSSLVKLATIFNPNEVPIPNRTCLLNSQWYGQLSTDPSLVTFFAGQRAPEIITDNELPKLGTFMPVEAPNLTNTNNTPNMVGMALHKAAAVVKTRLSNDYTQALPGSSYGSMTTITDPDIGISIALVQYVNHTGGYAEWRIQAMLGAAVGDKRGGLCITSQ